jgi:transcriptional regulator with XRE-family HTH domain
VSSPSTLSPIVIAPSLPLSALLRDARQARQFTLGQLSLRCGIHKSSLSRWEAEKAAPRTAELQAVMDALQLPEKTRRVWWTALAVPRALGVLRREIKETFLLPGDHLRALRLRSGKSQGTVAREIGVALSQVGKWERGESLPGGGNLHAFCHACGATAEEAIFVSLAPTPPREVTTPTLKDTYESLVGFATSNPPQVHDVPFLTLATQMDALMRRGKADIGDLVAVWGRHVDALNGTGRWDDAAPIAARIRSTILREGLRMDFHLTPALISSADNLARIEGPHAAIAFLHPLMERIERTGGRSWALAQLGTYHASLAEKSSAVRISTAEESLRLVDEDESESYYRRADLIAALLSQQRFDDALMHLETQGRSFRPHRPQWLLRDALLRTIAYQNTGSVREAQSHFASAQQLRRETELVRPDVPFEMTDLWNQASRSLFGGEYALAALNDVNDSGQDHGGLFPQIFHGPYTILPRHRRLHARCVF